ncbi:MAG: fibronectin type III domain-containing protein [Verrucomicrobiota bacterium]
MHGIAAPATPVLSLGACTGERNASTPIPNASVHGWRVALVSAPDAYVLEQQATAASDTFEGLTPGQIYLVDVNAVGSAGPSKWSDTAQLMVV